MVQKERLIQGPWPRRGLIALAIVTVYAAAGFLLAPWLIERTLVGTLDERLSLDTRVENLSLNPFALSLAVDGLSITDTDGETLLAFERLYVNFQLSSLFRWAWSFNEIHLIRPAFRLERISESDTNLSVIAGRWAATAEAPALDPEPEPAAARDNPIPRLRIADLRIVEGHVTVVDRTQREAFSTDLSPIDLHVAELSTLPDQSGRQQVTIRTESGARVTWTGSLSVNPVALSGAIELEGTYTPVLFRYFRDQLDLPLVFEGGEITARLDYLLKMNPEGALQVRLENLTSSLTGLLVQQPDHPPLVRVGEFSLTGGRFAWPEKTVHLDRIGLDDVNIQAFRLADGGYLPSEPEPTGTESVAAPEAAPEAAADAAPDPWQVSVGAIELTGWQLSHTDTTLEDGRLALSDFSLKLNDFSLADAQRMPLSVTAALAPAGTLELNGRLQLFPEVRLEATVSADALALAAAQPYLSSVANIGIDSGSISLTGQVTAASDPAFEYRGDFRLDALSLSDRALKEPLFSWDSLSVDKLVATPAGLDLSLLTIDGPYARVEIEQDGSTNIQRTFIDAREPATDDPPEQTETDAGETESRTPFHVIVSETSITSGSAHFTDLALPLPFEARVSDLSGELSTLATNSREPARVDLTGQVNEYGALNIDGRVSAFAPDQDTDITIDFDNVDLPRVSPYTIKFAGRAIAEGRTDLTLVYRLSEGALEGSNRLVIRDLTLGEKVEQPGAMNLPLDMAVALLKDGEGKLDFSFPVSGTLDDPSFSYSGAIMKALSNVLGGIVAAPFRLLGSLVGMAPDELEHIGFEPGASTLSPPQRETLASLTDALAQRPQLILQVSPVISPDADRRAMAEALVDDTIAGRIAEHPQSDLSRTEQRQQVLEALYDEAGLQPERGAVAEAHRSGTESGETGIDIPAYSADLREALITALDVPDGDLNALAQERIAAIRDTLTTVAGLEDTRIEALPTEEVVLNDDGLVQMSLNVTVAE